jgi:hypothetical protein
MCGVGLVRLVRLHDLEVGFGCLHRQCSCGNVPAHSVFKGMNSTAIIITIQLCREIMGYGLEEIFYFLHRIPITTEF